MWTLARYTCRKSDTIWLHTESLFYYNNSNIDYITIYNNNTSTNDGEYSENGDFNYNASRSTNASKETKE